MKTKRLMALALAAIFAMTLVGEGYGRHKNAEPHQDPYPDFNLYPTYLIVAE